MKFIHYTVARLRYQPRRLKSIQVVDTGRDLMLSTHKEMKR